MSGGTNEVQATFWLLDAPTSLVALSETQPDGVGLGTFNPDGTPWVYRKPVAANRSQTFIADAHEVRSRTFLAHIRHATAGELERPGDLSRCAAPNSPPDHRRQPAPGDRHSRPHA